MSLRAGAGLVLVAALGSSQPASRCTLRVTTAPGGRSVSEAVPDVPDAYVTYMGGGRVTVRCGDATMVGDSAVNYDHLQQAVMIGNVRYADTTRTMDAGRVTYFGPRDAVLAEGDVRLVRRRTRATLVGPHVEFFRTPGPVARTVATGRPRMTLPSSGTGRGTSAPFIIDADVAEFIGEDRAVARGDVEIHRSDLEATADSAYFEGATGTGVLYGDPVLTGSAVRLTGDSVTAEFRQGDLRGVRASGSATATGETFELASEEIAAHLTQEVLQRLWAFGRGRSISVSGRFQLAGDSIDFAFRDGELDTVTAVGTAKAVERPQRLSGAPLREADLSVGRGENWITGDTVRAVFEPAEPGVPTDSTAQREQAQLERLRAVGEARSFYAAVRDTARSGEPSKNYLIGAAIEIRFDDGAPVTVQARDAIGVYLEPLTRGRRE